MVVKEIDAFRLQRPGIPGKNEIKGGRPASRDTPPGPVHMERAIGSGVPRCSSTAHVRRADAPLRTGSN